MVLSLRFWSRGIRILEGGNRMLIEVADWYFLEDLKF